MAADSSLADHLVAARPGGQAVHARPPQPGYLRRPLHVRSTTLVAVSRASYAKLAAFRVVRRPRLTRSKTPVSKANCSGRPTPYNNAVDVLQHTAEDVGVELRLGNYPGSVVPRFK